MSGLARMKMLLLMWLVAAGPAMTAVPVDSEETPEYSEDEEREEGSAEQTPQERADQMYDEGTEALDEGNWDMAARAFKKAARLGGRRADGALYWQAYALNKQGRRPEALAVLELLRSSHPGGRWIDDAKALDVEIRQALGKPLTPEVESDEELKLVALNGTLNMDPDRALPLLERFLNSSNSPRLKEQALFVLVQTGSPRAREIVIKIARGQSNPDLQRKALEYLGLMDDEGSRQLLKEIYASSGDVGVKRSILQAFMVSDDTESLLAAAQNEKQGEVRREAIQLLGAQGAEAELLKLYRAEPSLENKEQILQALAICDSAELIQVARAEKEPRLRRAAIQGLGMQGSEETGAMLVSLYASEKDLDARRAVLDALMIQGNARALIQIARKEMNPQLRKEAVERLSTMGSKEATDYLLELLDD